MRGLRSLLATSIFLVAAVPGAASACDFDLQRDDPASIDQQARELVRRSTAIIDAEVVVPSRGASPARLRPLRVLKGPGLAVFLVGIPSTCDIAFLHAGERMRVMLSGGPDEFSASILDNGGGFASTTGPRRLQAALATLLGVPLPAGFTQPGSEGPPPPPRRRVTRRR